MSASGATLACVAGRINDEDIAAVRERARIDEVVGSYVNLRSAGGGSLKGLCPFHDEKTPSFQVTPSRGFFYCFGACGEGGDVFDFLQKIENLSFTEAVERLADRVGVQLRYTDDGGPRVEPGKRTRLLEVMRVAAEFFEEHLGASEAIEGRRFLSQRGFDRAAAEQFGVGYAPNDGRALLRHLRGRGFADADVVAAGLARESGWDFFQGRLLWPIRDSGKQTVGFGARRLSDADRIPAKYINTPETLLYKKSHVLYGLELARTAIGKKSQAVIVEGYTDVMAAHLSGVETAVASCGTAFGEEHARLLRRMMGNHDAFRGEVIFTFDGDAAGQAAALKVFSLDSSFVAQTYVAVEPTGLDPCDLRLQHGEAAVRELVARRVPLYRFVMGNILGQYDLDRADGRLAALRATAPLVASIRDHALVGEYLRELSGQLGMDIEEVRREVGRMASRSRRATGGNGPSSPVLEADADSQAQGRRPPKPAPPDPHDRLLLIERETAKLLIQAPHLFGPDRDGLSGEDFTHPAYAAVFTAIEKAAATEAPADGPGEWVHAVSAACEADPTRSLVAALAVERIPVSGEPTVRYATASSAKLQLLTCMRQIAELKSKLQRTNPVEHGTAHRRMFAELLALETRRQELQARTLGSID
jgi:DNA primase